MKKFAPTTPSIALEHRGAIEVHSSDNSMLRVFVWRYLEGVLRVTMIDGTDARAFNVSLAQGIYEAEEE